MEDSIILSLKFFFFIKTPLNKAKQCVYCCICFTLTIIDLKMVTKELLGLADVIKAQTLCIYKLLKVIIISKNKNLVFAVF